MKNKIQVLVIHGGMTFRNSKDYINYLKTKSISTKKKFNWTGDYLERTLGNRYEVIVPRMPLQDNAKYADWEILFGRYLTLLNKDFILIGNSLGGIFLAKYLSEHVLPQRAISTYLVCPPFNDTLPAEDLVGGFKLTSDLSLIQRNSKNLHLMFSKDDDIVPVGHAEKFRARLPQARMHLYESKSGHFDVSKFPEIVKLIKTETRRPKINEFRSLS